MSKKYFLCPSCKSLLDGMIEVYNETWEYFTFIDEEGEIKQDEKGKFRGSEFAMTECPKCEDYFFYEAKDLLVEIEDGKIIPIGRYWKEHKEEFEEAKKEILKKILKGEEL